MRQEGETASEQQTCRPRYRNSGRGRGGGDAVYGIGFVGALVYYIQQADGFWVGALGVLKAIVWPAFLVYDVLKNLAG